LAVQAVIDNDPVQVVAGLERESRRAGQSDIGRLLQAPTGRQDHLAEAPQLEVLGDVERLRQADEHTLVLLQEGRRSHR